MFRIYDKVYNVNIFDVSLSIFAISHKSYIFTDLLTFTFDIYCQNNEFSHIFIICLKISNAYYPRIQFLVKINPLKVLITSIAHGLMNF